MRTVLKAADDLANCEETIRQIKTIMLKEFLDGGVVSIDQLAALINRTIDELKTVLIHLGECDENGEVK